MTFPPCFSSLSAKPSIETNSEGLPLYQQQQQQSQLFASSIAPQSQPTFKPRSLTPDVSRDDSTNSSQDSSTHDEQDKASVENDAARMLLALSKIVTKEISTDSSPITKAKKIEPVYQGDSPSSPERGLSTMEQKPVVSPPKGAIPKSIDVVNHDWGSFAVANASAKTIPHEVLTTRSVSYSSLPSPLTPNTLPSSTNNISLGDYANNTTNIQRFRTVSLAGDELVAQDKELSPLLPSLTAPKLSFSLPNTNTASPPLLLRKQQLDLAQLQKELTMKLEHEALRRALGDTAYSALMASAAVPVTPVREKPRPTLSFKTNGIVLDGSNHNISAKSGLLQEAAAESKRLLPMDLPPLLFHTARRNEERGIASATKIPTRAYNKRKVAGKKQPQLKHGPRSNKKKASPKKQPRQRHTGKKFSWKAYPELEEFLITNREEYLSFSARNYTIEQRDYNNRLTSRLLEHAEANGYSGLFAACAFSAVRDRIRSYYKSYVQSFKRRRERQEQQDRLKKLEMQRH